MELSVPVNSCSKSKTLIPEEIQVLFVEFKAALQSCCHLCTLSKPAPAFPFHGKSSSQLTPGQEFRAPDCSCGCHTTSGRADLSEIKK